MKPILTLLFAVILGAVALANTVEDHDEVDPIKMGLVLDTSIYSYSSTKKVKLTTDQKVVRLYRRKNTLVKKALCFSTKRSKAKLA